MANERARWDYDVAIVGAGLSGLALATRLLERADSLRLLVVECRPPAADPSADPTMTFAYWLPCAQSSGDDLLAPWSIARWTSLDVVHADGERLRSELHDHVYCAVDWAAARGALHSRLLTDPRVDVVAAGAAHVGDHPRDDVGVVVAGGVVHRARWVFDSRPAAPGRLRQAFHGWWLETPGAAFDPSSPTLLDLSVTSMTGLGFGYVLPVTASRALVMAVAMGAVVKPPDPRPLVERSAGAHTSWRIAAEEAGTTELFIPPRSRRKGKHVVAIGQRGGLVRPSTGFGVARILRDSDAIAESFALDGSPLGVRHERWQDRLLDRVWIDVLDRRGPRMATALSALIAALPIDVVLRFLDGGSSASEILRVMATVPPGEFVHAALLPGSGARPSQCQQPTTVAASPSSARRVESGG